MRCLLVFGQHRAEALRITLGLGHDARLVGFRLFLQPRGGTHGTRNHIIGVGLRLVLGAFAFLSRLEHVVKSGLHLFGRSHTTLLKVYTNHLNPHLVAVQDGLHQCAHARADLIALFGQCQIHLHFSNHLAHGSFGRLHHRSRRILALEQVGARVAQTVLHSKLDFNNVLVFGEHGRVAQAGDLEDRVTPHVDRANLRHNHDFVALDGIRQAPIETSTDGRPVLAKLRDDGLLTLLHDEKSSAQPD